MASGNYPYGSSTPAEIIVDEIVDEDLLKTHIFLMLVLKN